MEGLLRLASVLASAIVVVSFALFVIGEVRDASERTVAEIAGLEASRSADPSPAQEHAREDAHGDLREAIDDANDIAIAPFAWITPDDANKWVQRGVPALLALLAYGLGIGFLLRSVRIRS